MPKKKKPPSAPKVSLPMRPYESAKKRINRKAAKKRAPLQKPRNPKADKPKDE